MQVHTVTLAHTHQSLFSHIHRPWHINTCTDKSLSDMLWYNISFTLKLNAHRPTFLLHRYIPQLDDTIWWFSTLVCIPDGLSVDMFFVWCSYILLFIFCLPLFTCTAGSGFFISFCILVITCTCVWEILYLCMSQPILSDCVWRPIAESCNGYVL